MSRLKGAQSSTSTGKFTLAELLDQGQRSGKCDVSRSSLHASEATLEAIPEALWTLSAELLSLNVMGHKIPTLPTTVAQLPLLRVLNVSENQLSELPEALCRLTGLTELDFSDNAIQILPTNFGALVQLKTLRGFKNKLKR